MSPVFLTCELREIESMEQRTLAPGTLMERAGHGAAGWLHRWVGETRTSFLVLCGPGNNGGDGFVCARNLRELGHSVQCWAPLASGTNDATGARQAWLQAGGTIQTILPAAPDPPAGGDRHRGKAQGGDVVVDAMFGIGLGRPLQGVFLAAADWTRASGARTVALDVPSGLDADTGSWVGEVAGVTADATLTFLGDKPGLHMADGCDCAGLVHVDRLGIADRPSRGRLNAPGQFGPVLARRPGNSHKGRFGNVAVIGGAPGMTGAAILAARACLRLGSGRVYLCCIGQPSPGWDPLCPELMFRSLEELPAVDAIVVGCGLGQSDEAQRALRLALASPAALVVDADALNLIAASPPLARTLAERRSPQVITPHPLEAARLLDSGTGARVSGDRVGTCTELAARYRAVSVLKGAGSVIVDGSDTRLPYWINATGGPALATAGTGDVLSGMIGAQLAQGHDALSGTLASVWLHGRAAQLHQADLGLLASEVATLAAQELSELKRRR